MKRFIGAFVLFALLILTVVALNNVSSDDTSTKPAAGRLGEIQSHE